MAKRRIGTIQSFRPGYGRPYARKTAIWQDLRYFQGLHSQGIWETGRGSRARTRDLRFWRPPLYQLSYTPKVATHHLRGRRFLEASASSVKSSFCANHTASGKSAQSEKPAKQSGVVCYKAMPVERDLATEVAVQSFIEIAPALLQASVALRVWKDLECRHVDIGRADFRAFSFGEA